MNDELVLFGVGLDQPIPEDENFWLDRVDEVMEDAIKNHDIERALHACESLRAIAGLSGKALAYLLYKMKQHWDAFDTGASFKELVYPRVGLAEHTIERYIRIAEMLDTEIVPKEFEADIKQRNMTELVPIANALSQGYELSKDDWKRLVQAPDYTTINKEVREIKGQAPRKSGLTITIDNMGTLWAYNVDERKFIGSLEIKDDNAVVQKAINRILDNAGVMRQ